MPRHLAYGQRVTGYLTSGRSVCLTDAECQCKCLPDDACHGICLPDEECQGICLLNTACVLQMQSVNADVVQMRGVRAFTFGTQRVSYRRRMSRQMCSEQCMPWHLACRRGVSGHLPFEHSACLTDTECQGRCRPDEGCQAIYLLNVPRVLQTQSVKADVMWTWGVRVFDF